MEPTDRLWQTIRASQDAELDKSPRVDAVMQRLLSRKSGPPRASRGIVVRFSAVAAALAMAAAIILFVHFRSSALTFRVTPGDTEGHAGAFIDAPVTANTTLQFSDGSRIDLLAGSRTRVTSLTSDGAHFVLEQGHASIRVMHKEHTHWQVDVGPFVVSVIGTAFDVDWDERTERFQLSLHEGVVSVSGSIIQAPVIVQAGQTFFADTVAKRVQLSNEFEASPAQDGNGLDPSESQVSNEPTGASVPSADSSNTSMSAPAITWQKLARAGNYLEAMKLVESRGFDAEMKRSAGRDLMLLGDTARFAGHTEQAREAYLLARSNPATAGRACYNLGQLAFDQEHDFAGASRWFQTYLSEQPQGPLACEAMGRLMEAQQRSGNSIGAKSTASQYLTKCNGGSHTDLAHRLVP